MEMEVVEERKVPPNETEDSSSENAKNDELLENQQPNLVANGDDSHSADSAPSSNDNNIGSPTPVSSPRLGFTSHFLLSDQEILDKGVRPSDIELFRRAHYQTKFGIDTWYHNLEAHTFKTRSLPLSYDEAEAIVQTHLNKDLSQTQEQLIQGLHERLRDLLQLEFPNGAFVKLNTRSPKDVPLNDFENEVVKEAIAREIDEIPVNERNDNNELIAFVKATNKVLKIETAEQAMQLLCRSQRIYEDLQKILQFGPTLFDAKIILREWLDSVPNKPEMEFRCFVHKNHLNAITQYFSFVYFPTLVQQKEHIKTRIVTFFESIKHHLVTHESYVIDFFVDDDRVLVIELNPFHTGAGAGLFSWKENRELFMHGPLEFRIVESLNSGEITKDALLMPYWVNFIDKRFHQGEEDDHLNDTDEEKERRVLWWPWTATAVFFLSYHLYKVWQRRS